MIRKDACHLNDYITLDEAIRYLNELRDEHGGKSMLDMNIEHAAYTNDPYIDITVLTRD